MISLPCFRDFTSLVHGSSRMVLIYWYLGNTTWLSTLFGGSQWGYYHLFWFTEWSFLFQFSNKSEGKQGMKNRMGLNNVILWLFIHLKATWSGSKIVYIFSKVFEVFPTSSSSCSSPSNAQVGAFQNSRPNPSSTSSICRIYNLGRKLYRLHFFFLEA